MNKTGAFCGIGVGPGEPGLLSVAAWEFVKSCDLIFVPRARTMEHSVARHCLPANDIPEERFREIEFTMSSDRSVLAEHYARLAESIAVELRAGKSVSYLTIGDPFTYSTYIYTLAALKDCLPGLTHRTYPGVTSYCALAAAAEFPLGESKEQVLILPCPDQMEELAKAIDTHEIIVLMKIGERLASVLGLLKQLGIAELCVFGTHVGMNDQFIKRGVHDLAADQSLGYLSTMLIRKNPILKRHTSNPS